MRTETLRDRIWLAAIVAILSFLGSVGASMFVSHLEERRWERQESLGIRRELLAKRMDLLERNIKIFNRLQTLDMQKQAGYYSLLEGEHRIRSGKAAAPVLDVAAATVDRVKEAQAELSVVLTMDAILFGPRTGRAVAALQDSLRTTEPWWAVSGASTQEVLNAAGSELFEFERISFPLFRARTP